MGRASAAVFRAARAAVAVGESGVGGGGGMMVTRIRRPAVRPRRRKAVA